MIAYRGSPMRTVVYACFSVPVGSLFLPALGPAPRGRRGRQCHPGLLYEDAELTREV